MEERIIEPLSLSYHIVNRGNQKVLVFEDKDGRGIGSVYINNLNELIVWNMILNIASSKLLLSEWIKLLPLQVLEHLESMKF